MLQLFRTLCMKRYEEICLEDKGCQHRKCKSKPPVNLRPVPVRFVIPNVNTDEILFYVHSHLLLS